MKIRFMHLHTPLFLAGTNYGDKLPGPKGRSLTMELDKWPELNGECAIKITNEVGVYTFMPFANTVTCEPFQESKTPQQKNQHPTHRPTMADKAQIGGPNEVFNAQVETPIQKVQGKPGRKAKFQGEETQGE